MKFGIVLPPFGEYADARRLADLARTAEQAGWDGFFIWDHMIFDPSFHPMADPWVALAAAAMTTSAIRLGTMVTPVARRRPYKLARETATLDRLSNGRLVLGVGLGDPAQWEYGFFGEETDAKARAKRLDEGLDILAGLWTGKPFRYDGEHYHLQEMVFQPTPLQQPRIPVWVGGNWDKLPPQRRAARWDGYVPLKWGGILTPDEWRVIMATINQHRTTDTPFDWVHAGKTPGDDLAQAADLVRPYVEVGVNWWVETVSPWDYGAKWEEPLTPEAFKPLDERIQQGPPRL